MADRGVIGYDDQFQRPDLYTSVGFVAGGAGAAVAGADPSNLGDPRVGRVFSRSGLVAGQQVEVQITLTPIASSPESQTAAMLVVVNPYLKLQSSNLRVPPTVRVTMYDAPAFASQFYQGTIWPTSFYGYAAGLHQQSLPFIFDGRDISTNPIDQVQADGGRSFSTTKSMKVLFTVPAGSVGTYDLFVTQICLMRGFFARVSAPFGGSTVDPTEVKLSYDGVAASTRKRVGGSIKAKLLGMTQPQVYGGFNKANIFYRSTLHAVGKVAGQSSPVMFVPDFGMSPRNNQTISADAGDARMAYGFLGPLEWELAHKLPPSADSALYESPIVVTEITV